MIVEVSELSLVERAVGGDAEAFSQLVRRHDDRMRAVAYRMVGSRAAMDDVLQAAYLNAYRNVGRFRAEADFATWLHRIVINACHDWLRGVGRRSEVSLDELPEVEAPGSFEDRLALGGELSAALQNLPPDHRAAVILVDGEGLSYAEAAAVLDVERGTVASRLSRARAALRRDLGLAEERRR